MPTYTYTVLHKGIEIAFGEAEHFATAQTAALAEIPDDHYPLAELTYVATVGNGSQTHTLRGKCF